MVTYDIDVLITEICWLYTSSVFILEEMTGFSLDKRLSETLFPTYGSSYRKCVHDTSNNVFNIILNFIL